MKKIFLAIFCILVMQLFSHAETATAQLTLPPQEASLNSWTFLRIQLLPNFPKPSSYYTYGLVLGLPASGGVGEVDGLEASLVLASTDNVKGVQSSFIVNDCKKITGLQGSLINIAHEKAVGLQAGATNVAAGKMEGLQFSFVNVVSEILNGCQVGIFNYADKANGVQIGLFNIGKKSVYQIGLINFIEDNWLQLSIIFNGSFNP